MQADAAGELALQALTFLIEQDAAGDLLSASGLAADEVRGRVGDPEFLGFVLDFVLSDEALLMAFCESAGLPYEAPQRARAALPGGDTPNWT